MKIEQVNNCTVIQCQATRLDASCAPEFIKNICKQLDELCTPVKAIILDLKDVEFVDSSGLGAIVLIFQKLRTKMLLCGVREQVEKLIKATKLDSIFKQYQDIPSALKAV
jgi:anti-anti-sigma factor